MCSSTQVQSPSTSTNGLISGVPQVDDPILELRNLKTFFFLERGTVYAVNGVNMTLGRQQTLGIVGESGCGKSITARSIMRLVQSPPGKIVDGENLFHRQSTGEVIELAKLNPRGPEIRAIRGGEISMIFQEPNEQRCL